MKRQTYIYSWSNNSKRRTLTGRKCVLLTTGKLNNCLVRFLDNGQLEVVDRKSLRKHKSIEQRMIFAALARSRKKKTTMELLGIRKAD